jgi:hypothetical protein
MKIILKITCLIGFIFFSTLFVFTYHMPHVVENSVKTFAIQHIADDLRQNYLNKPTAQFLIEQATQWKYKVLQDQKITQTTIDKKLPELIAATLANTCGYQCEKAKNLKTTVKDLFNFHLTILQDQQNRLTDIIKYKYLEVLDKIKQDLRIFLSTNALIFAFLLVLTFLKPNQLKILFLSAVLLTASTLIASIFYIFGQNWFYTILYNHYMGFGYLLYITGIFLLLLDVAINKARITNYLFNTATSLIGGALKVATC